MNWNTKTNNILSFDFFHFDTICSLIYLRIEISYTVRYTTWGNSIFWIFQDHISLSDIVSNPKSRTSWINLKFHEIILEVSLEDTWRFVVIVFCPWQRHDERTTMMALPSMTIYKKPIGFEETDLVRPQKRIKAAKTFWRVFLTVPLRL